MDELIRVVVDDAPATDAFNRIAAAGASADKAISGVGSAVNKTQSAINSNTAATQNNTTAARANAQQVTTNQNAFNQLTNAVNTSSNAINQMWNVGKIAIFSQAINQVWDGMVSGAKTVIDRLTEIQQTMSLLSAVDDSKVGENFEYILATADKYGVRISALQDNYAKLTMAAKGTAMGTEEVRKIFEATSTAARVLHLSNSEVNLAFMAIVQMASKGTVSMEELRRQFAERVPGAIPALSRELGVTTEELLKFIETGNAAADKMLPFLATALERTYGPGLAKASTALDAEINRIDNSIRVFFKQVYDADGSTGPAAAIRALNEKLVQPEVAENFAKWINQISGSIEDFIKSLTADDIANAANTFLQILQGIGNVAIMAGNGIKWLAENMSIIAPIIGALVGAKTGAAFGGWIGAGVGAVLGGIGGHMLADSVQNGQIQGDPQSVSGMQDQLEKLSTEAARLEKKISQYDAADFGRIKSDQSKLDTVNAQISSTREKLGAKLLDQMAPAENLYESSLPELRSVGSGNLQQLIGGGSGKTKEAERKAKAFRAVLDKISAEENDTSRSFNRDMQTLKDNFNTLGVEGYTKAILGLITVQKFHKEQVKMEADAMSDLTKTRAEEAQAVEQLTNTQAEWIALQRDPIFVGMSEEQQKRIEGIYSERIQREASIEAILRQRDAMRELNQTMVNNQQLLEDIKNLEKDEIDSKKFGISPARAEANRQMEALNNRKQAMEIFGGQGSEEIIKITEEEILTLQGMLGANGKKMRQEELQEWSNQWQNVSDGFVSAMMQGGDSAAKYIERLFLNMVLEPLLRPAGNALADMAYGSSPGGGWMGLISSFLSFDGGGRTGTGPRTGGVDGKGGFLGILHPDEEVIDYTKGGQSGNSGASNTTVIINNTVGDVATKSMLDKSNANTMRMVQAAFQRSNRYGGEVSRG
jgi:tape measure domain-containing protein